MSWERRMEFVVAYALKIASCATASLYGLMSAAGPYGYVKAGGLALVAFVSCHGLAWTMKAKQRTGWPGAIFGLFVTGICLLVTLWGGLGTNASGGAEIRAERKQVEKAETLNNAELARLQALRAALPAYRPTSAANVESLAAAVESARASRQAECDRRGPQCRKREDEEQAKRADLDTAQKHKAVTDEAARIDAQLVAVRSRLAAAPPMVDVDPQASAFSQLTGVSIDTAIASYALVVALAFELGGMFALLVAYSGSAKPAQAAPSQRHHDTARAAQPLSDAPTASSLALPAPAPAAPMQSLLSPPAPLRTVRPTIAQVPVPAPVTVADEPAPFGDVRVFMVDAVRPAKGEKTLLSTIYARYRRWCSEQSPCLQPVPVQDFGAHFKTLCEKLGLRTRQEGNRAFVLDVRIAG